jgi:hypothetical protein
MIDGTERCDGCGTDIGPFSTTYKDTLCERCTEIRRQSDAVAREAFESAFDGLAAAARHQGLSNAEILGIVGRTCTAGKGEMELIDGATLSHLEEYRIQALAAH